MGALIDSLTRIPSLDNAHWGILVVDPASGDTLYSRNAGKLFMPASNLKIVTASVALTQLGADYRYRTSIVAHGKIENGNLAGDLQLVGRGDPTVSDHMRGDAMSPLHDIADSLVTHGVTRISGRVVPAGDAFPGPVLGFGWSWDDLDDDYGAGVDELLFNEGTSDLHVYGGARAGEAVHVETRPARTFPRVRNRAVTIARADRDTARSAAGSSRPEPTLRATKDSSTWDIVLTGEIAAGDSATVRVTHHDPDAAYVAALEEALRDRGIVVEDRTVTGDAHSDTLFTVFSPTLEEILPALMKPSQNQIAEALLKTLGLVRTGVGTADSGRRVIERQLDAWGVRPDGAVIRDGSGLSRYDYLTPETVVRVLDQMRRSPNAALFYASLPIAGVDGSLRARMRATAAQDNLHAKTGALANARSLSGYVTTGDGRVLVFSMLFNNWTVPVADIDRAQDAIAVAMAGLRRR